MFWPQAAAQTSDGLLGEMEVSGEELEVTVKYFAGAIRVLHKVVIY